MPAFAFSTRLRLGALVLLASVLPLAVQAPVPAGTPSAGAQPAAWLQAQVSVAAGEASPEKPDARAAFDRALAKAKATETRTLHDFLTAFLDAHAEQAGLDAPATQGRTARALVAQLRQQLAQTGLAVRLPTDLIAPPTVPSQRARWAAAVSLLVPSPDRAPGAAEAGASSFPATLALSVTAALQRVAAPVARGALFRALFAGRRLGP